MEIISVEVWVTEGRGPLARSSHQNLLKLAHVGYGYTVRP
jgi:hypothetical protein